MITVDKINISLDISEHIPDEYIETKTILFYTRTRTYNPKYKYVTIKPKISIEVVKDSKNHKQIKLVGFNRHNESYVRFYEKFDIKNCECVFYGCSIVSETILDTSVIFELNPDYYSEISSKKNELLKYCGEWKIPINYNGDYIEYIREKLI